MRKKRIKYSNGSEVTMDKNIAGLDTRLNVRQQSSRSRLQNYPEQRTGFDPSYSAAELTGSKTIGGTRVTGSIYRDTEGRKNVGASVEQQLPKKSSITISKNKQGTNVVARRGNVSFEFKDPTKGKKYYGLRYERHF